jgi:chromosome segregation ATPase
LGQAGRKLSGSGAPGSGGGREGDLAAQLAKEQDLRQQAEGKVSQMNHEMEDLSVSLFQQANEMVATERRARAKLEERVEILERRDREKRERLERLEKALKRIDRVKELLNDTT